MTEKIAVLGAGSWGSTLATVLVENGHDVKLSEETKNKIAAFAPFEKVSLGSKLSGKDISIVSFDDYGVDREYKL